MIDALLSRLLSRVMLVLVALAGLMALCATGLVWLVNALTLWLEPLVGTAGAHALAGVAALLPLIAVLVALWHSARHIGHHSALGDGLRASVRNNPWESLGAAFFLGITSQGRHPDRAHTLLQLIHLSRPRDSATDSPGDGNDNRVSTD